MWRGACPRTDTPVWTLMMNTAKNLPTITSSMKITTANSATEHARGAGHILPVFPGEVAPVLRFLLKRKSTAAGVAPVRPRRAGCPSPGPATRGRSGRRVRGWKMVLVGNERRGPGRRRRRGRRLLTGDRRSPGGLTTRNVDVGIDCRLAIGVSWT